MRPLKDALPPASDKVLYVFYDYETTQNTVYTDEAELHVPISSARSSSVRGARTLKTGTACDAVRGSSHSGKKLWGTCFHI